jgi:hypothetical protein
MASSCSILQLPSTGLQAGLDLRLNVCKRNGGFSQRCSYLVPWRMHATTSMSTSPANLVLEMPKVGSLYCARGLLWHLEYSWCRFVRELQIIESLINKRNLEEAEAECVMQSLLNCGDAAQISAFLVLLRAKGETFEEVRVRSHQWAQQPMLWKTLYIRFPCFLYRLVGLLELW